MFDLQYDRIVSWIKDNGYGKIAIQMPEGLRQHALSVSDIISSGTSATAIIIGDACYGACDVRMDDADALIHFGHSEIPSMDAGCNILYVEARADIGIDDIGYIEDAIPKRIGLAATIQYVHLIPVVKEIFERHGKEVHVSNGDSRIKYPGQVLGCNCSAVTSVTDEVDAILYIGEGDFHPLAASLGTGCDVFVYNPIAKELRNMKDLKERMLRKRFAAIEKAKDAGRFMVIVCNKSGQRRDAEAETAVKKIRDAGRTAYMMVLNEISPERIAYYDVDAFVNTACPRIAMDDSSRYGKPMLTLTELDIALGLREWNDYEFDQI